MVRPFQQCQLFPCTLIGFTFSFPMRQHSLSSATLDSWAKSFNLPSVLGTDVVERLRDSLHKLGHNHIEVVAILNDTTSTLVNRIVLIVCKLAIHRMETYLNFISTFMLYAHMCVCKLKKKQ